MKSNSTIRSGWFRRAITQLRAHPWRLCTILSSAPVLVLAVSWLSIEWTDEGADAYPGGTILRDRSGNILRVSLGPGDTDCRPYYTASPDDWIVKALVAAEDGTFFSHCGVRPASILRAAFQNLSGGRRVSGASTITMQTVRLLKPHRKTYFQKWVEAVKALKMERKKDKLWIISQYLNRAPFGSNFAGIEAAAQGWFGKSAKDLGIGEAALLAGMVQAPSRFRPDRGYEKALKRRDYVLERMRKLGFIDEKQLEGALTVKPELCRSPRPFTAPYFCDWWMDSMRRANGGSDPKPGDFTTSLDGDIQKICENAVEEAASESGFRVAAVVIDVKSAMPVALACSGDYFSPDAGQVNTAMAPRPAGSTLKPFLLASALDSGTVFPCEKLLDVPRTFKGYTPANFDGKYRGRTSVKEAIVLSLNIPFVTMLEKYGLERFSAKLGELGFARAQDGRKYGLGLAIGNMETTLVELAMAYRRLATAAAGMDNSAFSRESAWTVSEFLSSGERSMASLGHRADVSLPRFAWKTGTSSAHRDAWTVAWNPEWVVGVWCGHVSGNFGDTAVTGSKAAAPVAWKIARALYPQNESPWFSKPEGVRDVKICKLSGKIASPDCPETGTGFTISGRPAGAICDLHRRDADGNVRQNANGRDLPALSIASPADGTTFKKTEAAVEQKIVCKAIGRAASGDVWWFLDGKYQGKTSGKEKLALDMIPGKHELSCTSADGQSAMAVFTVETIEKPARPQSQL